jgi:hypothetical protein
MDARARGTQLEKEIGFFFAIVYVLKLADVGLDTNEKAACRGCKG